MSKNLLKTAGVFAALVMGGFFAQAQSVSTPSGMPVYKNTGNAEADAARYDAEKEKWYLTQFNESAKTAEQQEAEYYAKKESDALTAQGLTAEQANFIQNKQAIMASNPEAYDAKAREAGLMGTNSAVREIPQSEFDQMSAAKQADILGNPSKYRVVTTTK